MTLKAGAIIIGSLIWDNNRLEWHNNLFCEKLIQVYLPIRYGRLSKTRKNTYTMVFSNICYTKGYRLGTAFIAPFKSKINTFNDLKGEAQEMGKAEGFRNGFCSRWGAVALLINPNKKIEDSFREKWLELMTAEIANHSLTVEKIKSEKSAIDNNGFLNIKWPKEVKSKNKIDNFHFLIATVTSPTLKRERYPNSIQIAKKMVKEKYYDYFLKNRENGITTFQDERISRRIRLEK